MCSDSIIFAEVAPLLVTITVAVIVAVFKLHRMKSEWKTTYYRKPQQLFYRGLF